MTFIAEKDNTVSKVGILGQNFNTWFGSKEFSNENKPLFSTPLPRPMLGQQIVDEFKTTPVSLANIFKVIGTMSKPGLFFVNDDFGNLKTIFVFKQYSNDTEWALVSRELYDEAWYGDVNIYSLTKI